MSWQQDLKILEYHHRTTPTAAAARQRLRDELEQPNRAGRMEAARDEAVQAAFDKIIADVVFAAPEEWELTKVKIRKRLTRMADWLISAPWLQQGALAIDEEDS